MALFFRNTTNVRTNPAKEETLASIKAQLSLVTSDLGTISSHTQVKATAGVLPLKNTSNTTVNPATQDTLNLIKSQLDGLTFQGNDGLMSTGTAPALAGTVDVKDTTATVVDIFTEEKITLLRRMLKLMESQVTTDFTGIQRVQVDSFGAVQTGTGLSGDGVPLVTVASDSAFLTGTTMSAPLTFLGWNGQMFQDVARDAYARAIRSRLIFS